MFGWDDGQQAHEQMYGANDDGQPRHEAKFSHELLGGAAAFEGMKLYEDRQRKEGKPVSHAFAKEMLMGLVGAEADRLAETKGMDEWDREKAKRHAKEHAERMYDDKYGGYDQYDPNEHQRPDYNDGMNRYNDGGRGGYDDNRY